MQRLGEQLLAAIAAAVGSTSGGALTLTPASSSNFLVAASTTDHISSRGNAVNGMYSLRRHSAVVTRLMRLKYLIAGMTAGVRHGSHCFFRLQLL
jgi:hypothetical protein